MRYPMHRRTIAAAVLMLGVLAGPGILAGQESKSAGSPGMVEWVVPALPTNKPQTDAAAEEGRQHGRKLPVLEVLQPVVDASLSSYQLRAGVEISGHFKAAASDIMPGLVHLWVDAFRKYYPKFDLQIDPPYAGSLGAQELVKGTLDAVFVSRELRPDDIIDFKAKFGYDPLSVPISGGSYRHFGFLDAVAIFVHKDNPIETIRFDQFDSIVSTTRHRGGPAITTWGQLGIGGEWADKPIHIYGVKPWNGFEEFVRQRVLSVPGKRGEWRDDINFDKLVFPVTGRVAADRYGIGYGGVAYIDAGVKVMALSEKEGGPAYPPTYENVVKAVYPLSRVMYLNLNKAPGKPLNPALAEFLRFVLSREGQELVVKEGVFIPLRAGQAAASRRLFEQ
jgi:phosphate transport system substrate-binding protein